MATSASIRLQFFMTTARQMSYRMRQRAKQTREKLERLVEGDATAIAMFLGVRPNYYLVPVMSSLSFFKSAAPPVTQDRVVDGDAVVIAEADRLYSNVETDELYNLLQPYSTSVNAELLWRLARVTSDKAKLSKEHEVKKNLTLEALKYAKKALELDDKNYACHKWYAVLLHYIGEFEGTKKSIINSYSIRDHFKKAIELNPTDATSIYSLGNWCYVVADLPWYQKKIAAVVFATPPSSSFEEALGYFEQAEKVDPNFYSMNHLMMGKCYLKLKKTDLAREYLSKANNNNGRTVDDERARLEATEALKYLPQQS